jgi:hypothetical protein
MDPREEARSLKDHPLPFAFKGEDDVLPTHIASIEKTIVDLEKEETALRGKISDLYDLKNLLIDRAIQTGHLEDSRYRIEKKISNGDRVADPKLLKEKFSNTWFLYETAYQEKFKRKAEDILEKAKTAVSEKIDLGLADKIFGKANVTACSTVPQTIRYEVVMKK